MYGVHRQRRIFLYAWPCRASIHLLSNCIRQGIVRPLIRMRVDFDGLRFHMQRVICGVDCAPDAHGARVFLGYIIRVYQ